MGLRSRISALLVLLAGMFAVDGSALARVNLMEGDTVRLSLDGYAMSLGGVLVSPVDEAPVVGLPQHTGLQSTVARANLRLSLGDRITIEVAEVLSFVLTSEAMDQSSPMGLGTSPSPSRWLDLRVPVIETSTATLAADIDRLLLRAFVGPVDLTIGRQPVTWGRSLLFKPTDIFTSLSPLDLDQTQKRGVDAVRASPSVGPDVELEAVVVDRGELDQLSGGARATFYLDTMDIWVGVARSWDQELLLAGVSGEVGSFKLRGEGALPWDEETEALEPPRVTLGADYFHPRWIVAVELHHNGAGAEEPSAYLSHTLSSRHIARGEVLNMGRWYGGALVSYSPIDTVHFSVTNMTNLQEPSAVFALNAQLDLPQSTQLGLGAFTSVGARPTIGSAPELGSEFGAYGHLVFLQLSVFL
ncbi:MAG: hypothetical protein VYE15_06440 [Myxococcota bacterium]|nr:hypothetical protein [Myxococcota bacterium]